MSSYSEDSLKDKLIKELEAEHCEVTVFHIYAQIKSIWLKFTANNVCEQGVLTLKRIYAQLSVKKYINFQVKDLSDGCGGKFDAVIVTKKFDGLGLLARHRLVNDVLKEELKSIHAFTQKTLTPQQWAAKKAQMQ